MWAIVTAVASRHHLPQLEILPILSASIMLFFVAVDATALAIRKLLWALLVLWERPRQFPIGRSAFVPTVEDEVQEVKDMK